MFPELWHCGLYAFVHVFQMTESSILIWGMFGVIIQLFGGCLVNMTVMSDWLNWLCFFNPFFYLFFGIMKVELTGYDKYKCLVIEQQDLITPENNGLWCLTVCLRARMPAYFSTTCCGIAPSQICMICMQIPPSSC